jgi:hypothetical protein
MKKQRLRRKALNNKKSKSVVIGVVLKELVLWDFSNNEDIIRHNAFELAKALQMHYNLTNFGPSSFGIDDENNHDI